MRFGHYFAVVLLSVLLSAVALFQSDLTSVQQIPNHAPASVCINPPSCTEQAQLSVRFAALPVQIEDEIYADLRLAEGWELQRAWVEGVNMFMGKTTVIIETQQKQTGEAGVVFFLGSCQKPTMHWRLKTEWKKSSPSLNLHHSVFAHFDFYTETD